MSDLLQKQARLQYSIERSLANFKKIGKANLTAATVRHRLTALQDYWKQFQDGHDLILQTLPSTTLASSEYVKDRVFEAVEDCYHTTGDFMSGCLEELEPVSHNQSILDTSIARSEAAAISLSHLPPIKLPPFDGSYAEWETFRDKFTALIINNRSLSDFTRMHFLSSSLKGRALDSINHIAVTAENFSIAWTALTQRFENKRRMLSIHFDTLLGLTEVTKESAPDLQALFDKMTLAVSSLTKLDRKPKELWDDLLVHLMTRKVDSASRKAWNIKHGNSDTLPTFAGLCQFMLSRIRAIEATSNAQVQNSNASRDSKAHGNSRVSAATASATTTSVCPLCKSRHLINSCPKFVAQNSTQRRETLKNLKRCFNCLSYSHSVQDCKSKYSCRSCGKRHHSMLHVESNIEPSAPAVSQAPETKPTAPAATVPSVTSLSASAVTRS